MKRENEVCKYLLEFFNSWVNISLSQYCKKITYCFEMANGRNSPLRVKSGPRPGSSAAHEQTRQAHVCAPFAAVTMVTVEGRGISITRGQYGQP